MFGTNVHISEDKLSVELTDGRVISVPISWYPRLQNAKTSEKENWRWIGKGSGIHWPDIDEDISIENILWGKAINGKPGIIEKMAGTENK